VSLERVTEEWRTRRAIRAEFVMAYDVFGQDVPLSGGYERSANEEKHALYAHWFRVFQKLLDSVRLKAHPTQKLEGGLNGVLQGLRMLKSGSISGKKLVGAPGVAGIRLTLN
jgi:hypothetical protein